MKLKLFLLYSIFIITSCKINYTFSGLSTEAKTATVKYFETRAPLAGPTLSQQFTEDLKDILISQTTLELNQNNADLEFEGEITDYRNSPVAIQGNETAALNRLTIVVNVRFKNNLNPEQNFESNFSRFSDYESSKNLTEVEAALIEEINEQLVQDILNKSLGNW